VLPIADYKRIEPRPEPVRAVKQEATPVPATAPTTPELPPGTSTCTGCVPLKEGNYWMGLHHDSKLRNDKVSS